MLKDFLMLFSAKWKENRAKFGKKLKRKKREIILSPDLEGIITCGCLLGNQPCLFIKTPCLPLLSKLTNLHNTTAHFIFYYFSNELPQFHVINIAF